MKSDDGGLTLEMADGTLSSIMTMIHGDSRSTQPAWRFSRKYQGFGLEVLMLKVFGIGGK